MRRALAIAASNVGRRGPSNSTTGQSMFMMSTTAGCARLLSQLSVEPWPSVLDQHKWQGVREASPGFPLSNIQQARCYATHMPRRPMPPPPAPPKVGSGIPGVKHIVAVSSGKGGVGKSTTAGDIQMKLEYATNCNHMFCCDAISLS